jgi:ABC-type cobalamin transport system ATPase subunit
VAGNWLIVKLDAAQDRGTSYVVLNVELASLHEGNGALLLAPKEIAGTLLVASTDRSRHELQRLNVRGEWKRRTLEAAPLSIAALDDTSLFVPQVSPTGRIEFLDAGLEVLSIAKDFDLARIIRKDEDAP